MVMKTKYIPSEFKFTGSSITAVIYVWLTIFGKRIWLYEKHTCIYNVHTKKWMAKSNLGLPIPFDTVGQIELNKAYKKAMATQLNKDIAQGDKFNDIDKWYYTSINDEQNVLIQCQTLRELMLLQGNLDLYLVYRR